MLSHLRLHRRGPSNPTSPIPPDSSPWDTVPLQPAQLVPEDGIPAPEIRPRSSNSVPFSHSHAPGQVPARPAYSPPPPPQASSSLPQPNLQPPTLPPITRVTSGLSDFSIDLEDIYPDSKQLLPQPQKPPQQQQQQQQSQQRDEPPKPPARSPYNEQSGFIGGLALENYRREQEALMNAAALNRDDGPASDHQSHRSSQLGRPPPPTRPTKAASAFIPSSHVQHMSTSSKRLSAVRVGSEPQGIPVQVPPQEVPKGKRGLPFLKNPMSTLLLRRKSSQTIVPDLSLTLRKEQEPTYDPRIRGTRVHDFSAPRPRKPVRIHDMAQAANEKPNQDTLPSGPATEPTSSASDTPPVPPPKDDRAISKRTSSSGQSQELPLDAQSTKQNQRGSVSGESTTSSEKRRSGISSRRKSAISASLYSSMSRNASGASSKGVLSSIPKHMKSTSSRFSFDMVGAAKQEKLLEERHRQKQQDKQVDDDEDSYQRDSRFDDFDEDGFDFDAMDYDDGLEERIPGVNADYDEEEDFETIDDPDNDQENFAGFVFQRSDPTTALTSPHSAGVLPTPRDVNGHVIGYASAGTTGTPDLQQEGQDFTGYLTEGSFIPAPLRSPRISLGLGIQDLETENEPAQLPEEQPIAKPPPNQQDELYFDDGLIHKFDGEGDGSAFDESIFDLDDTDQYGRPIPGMFARALSQRNATQEAKKRESDITSGLSQRSGASQSTAHTSLSTDQQPKADLGIQEKNQPEQVPQPQPPPPSWTINPQDNIVAYQAALAAAAHQAAASGKFRRDSDPAPLADLTVTSPTSSGSEPPDPHNENTLDDYEYDDGGYTSAGLDDYELDDDAIIAEANASALANDTDGWYGQEFGFYSAPLPQHHTSTVLSEKNLYQYANGGYFGPSGVNRTVSGRIVSREPNLTPITERSEYSNRNSLMSLMPSNSNNAGPIQSPGLAQLAMMSDDDNMSLSALMRFRSKAWGGSQVSLTSSRDGSPYDRNGATSPLDPDSIQARRTSTFSLRSQDSGAGSGSGSPTLTMSMSMPNIPTNPLSSVSPISNPSNSASPPPLNAGLGMPAPLYSPPPPPSHSNPLSSACPPVFEDEETDDAVGLPVPGLYYNSNPTTRPKSGLVSKFSFVGSAALSATSSHSSSSRVKPSNTTTNETDDMNKTPTSTEQKQKRPGMGHRHRGSADSISYMKEGGDKGTGGGTGGSGETRWVMERRRTADSGEIEVLRREIIDRGRI